MSVPSLPWQIVPLRHRKGLTDCTRVTTCLRCAVLRCAVLRCAVQWSEDFGEPLETCHEAGKGMGVFERRWSKATVSWNCTAARGTIERHPAAVL
jgi:hypothetical protein